MAILEVRDLIKQYRQSDSVITAVNRANFEVEDGEFVAITPLNSIVLLQSQALYKMS